MFLDEELNGIYEKEGFGKETSKMLFEACTKRLPNPNKVSVKEFESTLKQVDGSWRLFCKKHPDKFRADGFARLILRLAGEDGSAERVARQLGWTNLLKN